MPKAEIIFHQVQIEEQQLGTSSRDYLDGWVRFSLAIGGVLYEGMSVVVRHPAGTDITEVMEVEIPEGPYTGPWNHLELRDAVEAYVREQLPLFWVREGLSGTASGLGAVAERRVEIELPED